MKKTTKEHMDPSGHMHVGICHLTMYRRCKEEKKALGKPELCLVVYNENAVPKILDFSDLQLAQS